jgi:uncharacterized repeat protein (TIGR02543 family)
LSAIAIILASSLVSTADSSGAVSQIFSAVFLANAPGNTTPVIQTGSTAAQLQAFATMNFSYPNYIFKDWNTQPDGNGTSYSNQAFYSFTADLTLYAQWIQVFHSVTFYANKSPSDTTLQVESGNSPMALTSMAILGFANLNYTFADWNTQANGSGTSYSDQATYSFVADLSLYAQWTASSETLSFSSNAGTGAVSSLTAAMGSSVTLPSGTALSRTGYSFAGWNTMANGSGSSYQAGATIAMPTSETLYAQWTRGVYVVAFVNPGGHLAIAPLSTPSGNAVTLRSFSHFAKPGYSFLGWYTASVRGRRVGGSGASFVPAGSITLYAHWRADPFVSLTMSANGGQGHFAVRRTREGLTVRIPTGARLHRRGFTFLGWSSNPHSQRPTLRVGSRLVLTRTTVIYALWRKDSSTVASQVLLGSVGIFAPNSSVLTPLMRRYIASLARRIVLDRRTTVLLYGYATSTDFARGSTALSVRRALAVKDQLSRDLTGLHDNRVVLRASGEGRLSNSVLASFRNVEVFVR